MDKVLLFFYGFMSAGIIYNWVSGILLKIKSPIFLSGVLLHSLFLVLVVGQHFPIAILLFSALLHPIFGVFFSAQRHNLDSLFFSSRKTSLIALGIVITGFILWFLDNEELILLGSPVVYLFYLGNLFNYAIKSWRSLTCLHKGIWISLLSLHTGLSLITFSILITKEAISSFFLLTVGINSLISLVIVYTYLKTYYNSLANEEQESELLYLKNLSAINATKTLNERLLSLKNKALNNQTNPHFLFNSINSINSLILKSEIRKAKTYLSNLTEFLGLTFSEKNSSFYTLQEELNLIELYLRLENLRRDNIILLNLDETHSVNSSELYVPHLFFQSIIENSIIHGLSDSKGGVITIKLETVKEMVHISITDNGNGRKTEKGSKSKNSHKSAGLEILKNRLTYLEEHYRKTCSFEIKVIGDNLGTEVSLTFPVISTPPKFKML